MPVGEEMLKLRFDRYYPDLTEPSNQIRDLGSANNMLICCAFNFSCVMPFIRYIRVKFLKFGLLDCVRYIGHIIIPGLVILECCSTHFIVTLAGLTNIFPAL